ncbi:MAG TPA: orotate phosphoribosyltransferase, partial [Dehalococcoidia bacterium]|nr:orotate phosphoribosyltransferase [Dehalococcoidia bacterium]
MNQSLLSSPMTRDEIEQLRQAMQAHCFQHAPAGEYFTLTSGRKSRYYYNGKMVTLHPRWRRTIGDVLAEIVLETRAEAVGGMALGACPIADAVSDSAYLRHGTTLPVFIVRPAPKGHGTREEMAFAYAEDGRPLLTSGRKVAI